MLKSHNENREKYKQVAREKFSGGVGDRIVEINQSYLNLKSLPMNKVDSSEIDNLGNYLS